MIKKLNKDKLKKSILEEGNSAYNSMMLLLSRYRFVNLMIDAATVNRLHVVHSTLSNRFSLMAPLPFRSEDKNDDE